MLAPMRLVTYEIKTALGRYRRLGALVGEKVADLNFACAWRQEALGHPAPYRYADAHLPASMKNFLIGGNAAMQEARQVLSDLKDCQGIPEGPNEETLLHDARSVRLTAPVPEPNSLRDFYAFEEHVRTGFMKRGEEIPAPWYEIPVYYKGNARTMIGPDEEAPWPRFTGQLDFELELACVIGREGRNLSVDEALSYVAGYMVMNDLSARDIQRKEMAVRLGPAKGKDFATAIGPALVTPDEVGDLTDLPAEVRVNGEVWSRSNAGNPYWNFAQMIAHVSMDETLYPGDILASGTVGRGCGLELDRWIQPGDVVELEIARVGVLRNPVGRRIEGALPRLSKEP
jgi:2-keto-4-pentenoate hydratase/2-oxohepta-3-ene-1,7-dioic acid hydratase in catechol pathway